MPPVTDRQRRFFYAVQGVQEGREGSREVRDVAREMTRDQVRDFTRKPVRAEVRRPRRTRRK